MTHLDPSRGPRVSPGGLRYYHMGYAIKCIKKIVHFSNSCQIAKYTSKFKILTIFRILIFLPFRIRRERRQNRWFWAILGGFFKKTWPIFRFFAKIAQNRLKLHKIRRRIQIGQTLPISKLSNFLKFEAYLAIWWPIEN